MLRAWAATAGWLVAALALAFAAPRAASAAELRRGAEAAAALDAELRSIEAQRAVVAARQARAGALPGGPIVGAGYCSGQVAGNRGLRGFEGGIDMPVWLPGEARSLPLATAGGLAAMFPAVVGAHLPAGARGPNGGEVRDLGSCHGELVARDGELVLFLFDHNDRPLDARRASGTAIVLAEGQQQTLPFSPREDGSAAVARGEFRATRGPRVVAQVVTAPGVPGAQARFAPIPRAQARFAPIQ